MFPHPSRDSGNSPGSSIWSARRKSCSTAVAVPSVEACQHGDDGQEGAVVGQGAAAHTDAFGDARAPVGVLLVGREQEDRDVRHLDGADAAEIGQPGAPV